MILRILLFLVGATLLLDQLEALQLTQAFFVSPNKALTALLLGAAALHWLLTGGRLPSNPKTWWVLGFYVSLAISSVYAAANGADTLVLALLWTTYLAMFLFYFLLCYVLRTRRDLDIFLSSLLVSGFVATISALLLEGSGGVWSPLRRSGIGSGENQAAGNLLMILPFVFALSYRRRSLILRMILYGLSVVFVVGFAIALSRSAFLGALAMGSLWMLRLRRLSDLRIVIAGIVLAIVAYSVAPSEYAERISSLGRIFGSAQGAFSHEIDYRATIYKAGAQAFLSSPVIGVGTEQFRTWAAQMDPRLAGIHEIHNAVLKVAANQGLVGLVPYLALLIVTFRDLSRVQRLARRFRHLQDEELDQLYIRAVTAQVGFIGILTVAMFQPGTFWRGIWAIFAVSTVLLALTRQRFAELGIEPQQVPQSVGVVPSTASATPELPGASRT